MARDPFLTSENVKPGPGIDATQDETTRKEQAKPRQPGKEKDLFVPEYDSLDAAGDARRRCVFVGLVGDRIGVHSATVIRDSFLVICLTLFLKRRLSFFGTDFNRVTLSSFGLT